MKTKNIFEANLKFKQNIQSSYFKIDLRSLQKQTSKHSQFMAWRELVVYYLADFVLMPLALLVIVLDCRFSCSCLPNFGHWASFLTFVILVYFSIFHGLHCSAQSATGEAAHGEEWDDPERGDHGEVVGHGPSERSRGSGNGSHTHSVVFGEQQGTDNDLDDELEHAHEECAVGGDHSAHGDPGADEREESIQANESIDDGHKDGNDGKLGTSLLAINIAVFQFDLSIK